MAICDYCGYHYDDIVVHLFCACTKYAPVREVYWNIITDEFSVQLSTVLHSLPDWEFVCFILHKSPIILANVTSKEHEKLLVVTAKVWYCLRKEHNKLNIWV